MISKRENQLAYHFARLMAEKSGLSNGNLKSFREIVEKLIISSEEGHSCLPLSAEEADLILNAKVVSRNEETPLILYNDALYLHRYYHYEMRLAMKLNLLTEGENSLVNLEDHLDKIFGEARTGENLQRRAAELAAVKNFAVISGGPGTGKTSTVVRIIDLLLRLHGNDCTIALAAPTGKAAARLQQSMKDALANSDLPKEFRAGIPEKATTIHRMLGVKKNSPQFKYNRENTLEWDVVIVDEASMVDLALMSKLVDALKPQSKLILLGDKDQLASVEAGAVLADVIKTLPQNTVILQKSYRFNTAIKELSLAVNSNNSSLAWSLLKGNEFSNIQLLSDNPLKLIYDGYMDFMMSAKQCALNDYGEMFRKFNTFKVLCATRSGKYGIDTINLQIENHFFRKLQHSGKWYPGKPVIITRNDYSLGLYNGDIGICLADRENQQELKIWFEDSEGQLRSYLPYRLPEHQTAYALTVHKSQGSEFKEVVIFLPSEESAVLSRELVYTAVTRAREKLWLHCEKNIFDFTLAQKIKRASGLAEMLTEMDA